jgi:competence protein ComEA
VAQLSRAQLLVYGAIAVAVLLLGARWLGSGSAEGDSQAFGAVSHPDTGGSVAVDQSAGGLVVHVAGEVRKPGVYRLSAGSRVTDAVERAGGVTPRGSADAINLAATLADGQQIVVPARAVGPVGVAGGSSLGSATAPDGPISLGTATVEQLDTIEGIGPVTAADIIEFRDQQGGLSSVDELDQVSGIGPATMEALRARLQP